MENPGFSRRTDEVPPELVFGMFGESAEEEGNFQPAVAPWDLHPRTRDDASDRYGITLDYIETESFTGAAEYLAKLVEEYQSGNKPFAEMPVGLYQRWGLLNWRRPHNTSEAAEYWLSKIREETREFCEEIGRIPMDLAQARFDNPLQDLPHEADNDIKSELGDLLFVNTAAANMLAIDVENATAHMMLEEYGKSSKFITLGEIDEMVLEGMQEGYAPEFLRTLEYERPVVYWSEYLPNANLHHLQGPLFYGVYDLTDMAEADEIMQPGHPNADRIAPSVGKLWVLSAFYARVWANSSLSEVLAKNIDKISGRVQENSLEDKSRRSEETK